MDDWIFKNEPLLRLGFFFGVFLIVAIWEVICPRRQLTQSKMARWTSNLLIVALNTVFVRLIFSVSAVLFAAKAQENSWGLFNNLQLSPSFSIVLSILLLDLAIYLQHVMFHLVPLLWRLHRVHHADLDYDVTTGARFHPIEIVLSMGIKFAVIATLGASPISVLIFEIVLNASAMFNHGNIYLPLKIDKILRLFIVTPDMHRVHHSIRTKETNSNFGFNVPWWDRLFRTYLAQPQDGHHKMTIGIELFRDKKYLNLKWLLLIPFLSSKKYRSS